MQVGKGVWLRVKRDRLTVLSAAEDGCDGEGEYYIGVPRRAFVTSPDWKATDISALEFGACVSLLVHDGKALSFDDLRMGPQNGAFDKHKLVALFYPEKGPVAGAPLPTRADASRILPTTDQHLAQVFGGKNPLSPSMLDAWNAKVAAALDKLPEPIVEEVASLSGGDGASSADPLTSQPLLMNAAQRGWLVAKGAVPKELFDRPKDPGPDGGDGGDGGGGGGASSEDEESPDEEVYALAPSDGTSSSNSSRRKQMYTCLTLLSPFAVAILAWAAARYGTLLLKDAISASQAPPIPRGPMPSHGEGRGPERGLHQHPSPFGKADDSAGRAWHPGRE